MKQKNKIKKESIEFCGWGLRDKVFATLHDPKNIDEIQNIIKKANSSSIITRGLGRSYGDAAQLSNALIFELNKFNHIKLDKKNNSVIVGAGVTLDYLLKNIVPLGYFIPVSPGTKFITIGGAIASDIHGKNHHINGSFGNHLKKILLIDGIGNLIELFPDKNDLNNSNKFWATVGGMGLTGVILEATFSLIPISSSMMKVDTYRYEDLNQLMNSMVEFDDKYKYSVAWIDSLNKKGRGVVTCAEHSLLEELKDVYKNEPLKYTPKTLAKTPNFLPSGLLNKLTVKLFNEAWYRKGKPTRNEFQTINSYFYPLDGVKEWNKIYGPQGFIQYQFVVPDNASYLISETLEILRKIGAPTFLTVLKRFGPSNASFLSFPIKGWTLAIDIPASVPSLFSNLNHLDKKIASEGGRIYLSKDSRQSKEIFYATYKKVEQWRDVCNLLDPNHIFESDLSKRLGIK